MATPSNILRLQNKKKTEQVENHKAELEQWIEKNRFWFQVLLDAYCVLDTQNRVVEFNEAFTELTGESYRKVVKIGDFCELIKMEGCPDKCPAKGVLAEGKAIRLDEIKGFSKSAENLQLIFGGIPILSDSGKVLGCVVTIRNVSAENELLKKYDERKKESVIDGLTQLFNKSYTESQLLRLIKSCLRGGEPKGISVIMCDIDHFKKVNDTYGHQAGDYVLSCVADIAKKEIRDNDLAGRFGGEEFILLLANSEEKGALVFAERLRAKIEKKEFVWNNKTIPITVSLGVASFFDVWKQGTDPVYVSKDLVNRADTALYYAKENGRNRSCQYETLPTTTPKK